MLKNTKSLHTIFGAATALGLLLLPGVAGAAEAKIIGFTHAGNGCPANTVGWVFDEVNNLLTVSFDRFAAKLPPGGSKACTLTFVVDVPSGFQLSMNRVEYIGYRNTEPSVWGQLRRKYKYGTNPELIRVSKVVPGQGDYSVIDKFPGWSLCEDTVTVNATTRVDLLGMPSGTYNNEIVVDYLQYDTHVDFYFSLLPC